MSDCPICGRPLTRGERGPLPTYCSPRCRQIAYRRRHATDWTHGDAPVRITHVEQPRVRPDDLEARALIQQRSVFRAAEELSASLPPDRAWRWKAWLESLAEFVRLFGGM